MDKDMYIEIKKALKEVAELETKLKALKDWLEMMKKKPSYKEDWFVNN